MSSEAEKTEGHAELTGHFESSQTLTSDMIAFAIAEAKEAFSEAYECGLSADESFEFARDEARHLTEEKFAAERLFDSR